VEFHKLDRLGDHPHIISMKELSSIWDGRPFLHNRHGPESGGCCAPFRGGELGPQRCGLGRGLPPYQVASWSIQLFGHNTPMLHTDKQRSEIMGWTVLQTVAPKPVLFRIAADSLVTTYGTLWILTVRLLQIIYIVSKRVSSLVFCSNCYYSISVTQQWCR